MNLWNTKNLPMPPINTYKALNKKIDIRHLNDVFEEGRKFFDDDKYMYAEHAVLSRIVYRMKQKFRSAKDFKALEKINKALDNYFKTDISKALKSFMQLIPSRYKAETYLPTKNLLDYILVRLQGLVKLLERIVETCKIAAYLLDKRIHTGHFWKVAFLTFSIVSRLYVLAKYTAKFICEFYGKLIPFSSQLSNTSTGLSEYTFPKDLKEWMNVDWLEIDDEIQIIEIPTEVPDIIQFFDLVDDDDEVEFCDEYVMIRDEEDMETKENLKRISKMNFKNLWDLRGFDTREDVGEVMEINDSMQMHMENSFSQKPSNSRNDTKDILIDTDSKHNIIAISDTSGLLEDGNVDSVGDDSDFILQQKKPKTEVEEKPIIITLPDTPLVNRKKNKIRNKREKNFKVEKNEDEEEHELKCDTDIDNGIIKIEDDSIISISDNSLMETIDENVVKKKKKTKKRTIQKRDSIGNSDALLHRVDARPMKRKLKKPHQIVGISVKSILELTENTRKGEPTTSFNNVSDNRITKNKKIKKNKKNRVKNGRLDQNLENSNNDLSVSNKIHDLPNRSKERKRFPQSKDAVKQESGEPSTSNFGNNSKKRKIQKQNENFENRKVENLKKALLANERSKQRLEANLSKALQKVNKKKSSGKMAFLMANKELQQINKDIKELAKSDEIILKHEAKWKKIEQRIQKTKKRQRAKAKKRMNKNNPNITKTKPK